jgi:predicted anti-sigma-YlaC factor YlaD
MICEDVRKKIELLKDGILNPPEEGAVKDHLGACEDCKRYVDETARIGDLLREYVKDEIDRLPENVILGRVEASIQEVEEKGKGWFLENIKYLIPAFVSAVALILILVYPSMVSRNAGRELKFAATVESIEAENATVMLVDKGADTPKVIWIIEREEI